MGAIKGKEYIDRLNLLNNEIWYDGEKLRGCSLNTLPLRDLFSQKRLFMICNMTQK